MNDSQPTPFVYTPKQPMISINATYPDGSRIDSLIVELNDSGVTSDVFDAMMEFIVALSERTGAVPSKVTAESHDSCVCGHAAEYHRDEGCWWPVRPGEYDKLSECTCE